MMSLPQFEDPNPTVDFLRKEQNRLKTQADKMISQTKIMDLYSKYGKVSEIGGSYKYNLMIYPDLDLGVIANKVDNNLITSLLSDLVKIGLIRSINYVDTYHFGSKTSGRPKGYWIGLEIPFENDRWGIDCWFQELEWTNSNIDDYADKLTQLNPSAKDAILMIKYQLIYRGLYGNKYYSSQVYDAVIEHGALTIDQFLSLY